MSKSKEVKLPAKLSELIKVAIHDLSAVERATSKYQVNMDVYHAPDLGEKRIYDAGKGEYVNVPKLNSCTVCFAGAVMAKSLKAADVDYLEPVAFSPYNRSRLYALNNIRQGEVESALSCINRKLPFGLESNISLPSYEHDPAGFKDGLRKLSKTLAKLGE